MRNVKKTARPDIRLPDTSTAPDSGAVFFFIFLETAIGFLFSPRTFQTPKHTVYMTQTTTWVGGTDS
ncbi:hypothetical protein L2E38_25170, partial [Salmonella enterica subsp. enterica serovar Weltevreden]|nr:hypothetical protein [Salmonella enterica subsp. enterica serovar Weltevreden]